MRPVVATQHGEADRFLREAQIAAARRTITSSRLIRSGYTATRPSSRWKRDIEDDLTDAGLAKLKELPLAIEQER